MYNINFTIFTIITNKIWKVNVAILCLLSFSVFGQKDGYWDKNRSTTKEIIAPARKRIVINSEDFPVGTTEVVYRITILNGNQQLASSLASVLKAVPDPSGISQGSAGAIFILSKVSGEDKCTYSIFASAATANQFKDFGRSEMLCWSQNEPVNKDSKLLTLDKLKCTKTAISNLYFVFENKNWMLNQKIVLEIVPWVNYKFSNGWTSKSRAEIIRLAKTSALAKKMINADDFSLCILDKIENRYKFQEYSTLLAIEKMKIFKDFGNACLNDDLDNATIFETIRTDVATYLSTQKYEQAIDLLTNTITNRNSVKATDYYSLGSCYLYCNQYDKAINVLTAGEKLDNSDLLIKLQLANAYVLTDNYKAAKVLHKKYKTQNVSVTQTWISKAKAEINSLQKAGHYHKNFDKILEILEE